MTEEGGSTWSQRVMVGYWDPSFRGRSQSHIRKLLKQWKALGQWPPPDLFGFGSDAGKVVPFPLTIGSAGA